ncbi:hypothetical protein BC833DRAFT_572603 [Globomyces pollinis-pini]|nr:hypothetical protein BC833DRAFT_572603 [Globomyces pollinis-pini]
MKTSPFSNNVDRLVFMSNYNGGTDNWFLVERGYDEIWDRDGWEILVVKHIDGIQSGIYVLPGVELTYRGPGMHITSQFKCKDTTQDIILLKNQSDKPIEAFMTKYAGGNDDWFTVLPGQEQAWFRDGYDMLVVKDNVTGNRAGVYVKTGTLIDFNGF